MDPAFALRATCTGGKLRMVKPITDPRLKTDETDGPVERGYDAWKRAKIERGLAQAQDRAAMIPVEQLLADLKLDRYFHAASAGRSGGDPRLDRRG